MSKYKFLILILMVIKSLYYSEAIDFTDILRAKEVDGVFIKRMTERGLPIVGELYSEYQTRFNNNGQSASIISKEEYQILMDSIPRINESLESIKTRNDKINKEGSHVVHSFQQEDIDALKLYYPRVYETDIEYVRRLWRNNSVPFPLPKTIFKLLKSYCPNIGEIHNEYLEDRKNDFGIGGYSEQEFTVFLESYPTILENDATFLKRIGLESLGLDESNSSEYYLGLWSLIPIYAETYKEYSDRMKLKELVPMKRESFVFYQAYYPNLCVRYYDFKNQLSTYEQTEPRFQKLKFIIYSLKTYNHFKTKFPRPFESQKIFDNRSIDDSGYLHFIFKSSFAKRMYPKMTETYEDYLIRIALLDLKPIPEEYFIEYKKNYPQIHIAYDKIGFQYGKNENKKLQKESLLEIMMDEPEFGLLIRRLPIIYENYSMYRERITMLELLKFEEKEKKKDKI